MGTAAKKMFVFNFSITCGEYEFSQKSIVWSTTQKKAEKLATNHIAEFYGPYEKGQSEKKNGLFFFHGGQIAVKFESVIEQTADQLIQGMTIIR